jgi:RHS repeat-associated protein
VPPLDAEFPSGIRCTGPSGDTAANAEDQLCQYGGFTYVYNARGQLQTRSDGSVTTTYTYDGLGRLLGVTEPGMDIHYVLDALGRRIGKIRDGNLEKGWLYADALHPIAELDGSGHVRATFLYGTRAHVPDAMVLTDGTVYRLITDHLGSVRLVVNAATGEVAQRIDYDAFGRVLQDTNPDFQPFGFAGGLYDDDTGLVRFGARDYDAVAGRWTAKDPVLFEAGAANLYSYVLTDPVNNLDPSGLFDVGAGAGVGAAAAAGAAIGGIPGALIGLCIGLAFVPTDAVRRPPPTRERCLDACHQGTHGREEFCRSIPKHEAKKRAECWAVANDGVSVRQCESFCRANF